MQVETEGYRRRGDGGVGAATRPPGLFRPRYWAMWLEMGTGRLLAQLPYRALMAIGAARGVLEYQLLFVRRRRAAKQILLCFPQRSAESRKRLLRAMFVAYGMGAMERLIGLWWPRARLQKLLNSIDGLEHLQCAQAEGRGVLLLVTHGTSMELSGNLLRCLHPIDASYLPPKNAALDWLQMRARGTDRLGEALDANKLREMLRRLRSGRVVWYAPDRYYEGKPYVMAPLFGKPAATITATSKYARLTGAEVMTLDYWRAPGGGYDLRIGAPWADFPSADLLSDCTRINAWIEDVVTRHPEQHRWIHKRFKTPRGGATPPHLDILDCTVSGATAPANECGLDPQRPPITIRPRAEGR